MSHTKKRSKYYTWYKSISKIKIYNNLMYIIKSKCRVYRTKNLQQLVRSLTIVQRSTISFNRLKRKIKEYIAKKKNHN